MAFTGWFKDPGFNVPVSSPAIADTETDDQYFYGGYEPANRKILTLYPTEKLDLAAELAMYLPSGSTYSFKASNSDLAKVDKNNILTGVGVGKTYVQVWLDDVRAFDIQVQILQPEGKADLSNMTIAVNDNFKLNVTNIVPANGVVTLEANNKNVEIQKDGRIKGVSIGTSVVSVKVNTIEVATCKVTILEATISLSSKFLVTNTNNVAIVTWGKVPGATSYVVRGAYCKSTMIRKIAETTKTRYTFQKLNKKKLDPTKCLKIYVVALKNSQELARTKTAHIALPRNRDYTNVKRLSVSPTSTKMYVGAIKNTIKHVLLEDGRKKELPLDEHQGSSRFTYASSNPKVARVNVRGEITAVGRGTCDIWVYALNGRAKSIKVTVQQRS